MKKFSLVLLIAVLAGTFIARAADIVGTITLKGTPPPEVSYTPLVNNPSFQAYYKDKKTPTTHFYVVGPNHGLGDVIVYLKNVNQSTGSSQPPAVLDQKGGLYHPQIIAIQTGQKLLVKNSDDCMHNVDVQPTVPGNPASNQMQPPGSSPLTFTFPKPEMFITFKCDIHPWMFAWVSVMGSPYYDISNQEGKFVIKNVPPGTYTVAAAHRKLGTLTKQVVVKGDENVPVNFTFEIK
jgi:plastocyanin